MNNSIFYLSNASINTLTQPNEVLARETSNVALSPFALERWVDAFSHMDIFLKGLAYTLGVSILALSITIIMGIIHSLMATGRIKIFQYWARIYVEFFQNIPLLIVLFFFYFVFPRTPYVGLTLDPFTIGVIGIGIYHGAYMSEVMRSGINSISKGQFEAASSQGFNYIQQMFYIILPQTIKIILPPGTNQAINLIKNTSALTIIAGAELMYRIDSYATNGQLNYAPAYIIAGLLYFIVCYTLAFLTRAYENKLKKAQVSR